LVSLLLEFLVATHKEFNALGGEEIRIAAKEVEDFKHFQSALELALLAQVFVLAAKFAFFENAKLLLEQGLDELIDGRA
jgi:hypothetical protein